VYLCEWATGRRQDVWSATKCPSPRCGQLCDNRNTMTCLFAVPCAAQESMCVSEHRCPQCTLRHGDKKSETHSSHPRQTDTPLPHLLSHSRRCSFISSTPPVRHPTHCITQYSNNFHDGEKLAQNGIHAKAIQRCVLRCVVLCCTVFPTTSSRHPPPPPSPTIQFELPLLPSPVLWNVDRFRCGCMSLNLICHGAVMRPFECT
jgi:hypothetical protein